MLETMRAYTTVYILFASVFFLFVPSFALATTTPQTADKKIISEESSRASVSASASLIEISSSAVSNAVALTETTVILSPGNTWDIWTTSTYSYDGVKSYPGGGLDNDYLVVGGWGDLYYSLLRFDLAGLPADIVSARLELYSTRQRGAGNTPMFLDRITRSWDWWLQGTGRDLERLWWADRPTATQVASLPSPTQYAWYSIDITNLYRQWQDGTYPNYGIQLRPATVSNTWNEFFSSDYDNPEFLPRLVLTTEEPLCTQDCSSNVLFLPGIKGSVLKVNNDTVWPPSFWSDDLPELALTTGGDSVNPVVVDGVLETFYGTPIYSGFTAFMDELVASGTTTEEWKAFPYDWRFSPERILADGIQTPTGIVDTIEEIKTLAARSGTGKVTIIAHSMGGLLGKAIIKKLQDEGKENLIDSFIMIGTPQLGTPQAAASLLHGDDEGILAGFIVDSAMVRKIVQNFQSTYDLLPSPRYFDEVAEPIIVFDPNAVFTQAWRDYWGPAIDNYAEFFSFITGGGVSRTDPDFSQLHIPEILRTDLVEHARDFHAVYDTYAFPDSIRVVQVAGWGLPTVKAIEYKTRHFRQNYEPLFTREGDRTVVYPSAISSVADETYFFNIFDYNDTSTPDVQHRNLLDATAVKDLILSVLKGDTIAEIGFITETKPPVSEVGDQLIVSTHSPVILGAYDEDGHFSGINQNQDLGVDVLLITEDIPGSTFLAFGDSQYLFLSKEGSYTVAFSGTGSGPTDVDIENFTNDTPTLVATYSDIPVTASTSATFIANSASPQDAHIQIDSNSDGQVDIYIAPDNQSLTLNELLTNLKTVVQNLAVKDKLKTNLLKKIKNIEKKIAKQKNKKVSKAVMNFEKQIIKKWKKSKLSDADVAEIVRLLGQIESAL